MDGDEVLVIIGRYGFASAHCNTQEKERAWNAVVAAVKQLSNDSYSRGCASGDSED